MDEAGTHRRAAGPVRGIAGLAVTGLLAAIGLLASGCGSDAATRLLPVPSPSAAQVGRLMAAPDVAGDPAEGRRLFLSTGCAGCHTVQDVPTATGIAGPNLTNVVLRPTLAGDSVPMSPETLSRFLLDPSAVKPGTTMPDVGLTPEEAQQLTAFLYSQPYNPLR